MYGKWLLSNKTIEFYDLKSGGNKHTSIYLIEDVLEFKKKHRPIKVRMLDGALKTVIIDESLPVSLLVSVICDKIGIANPDEYSLLPNIEIVPIKKDKKDKKSNITEEGMKLN